MRQILETEDHVVIPPMIYSDPFYRITHLIKEEIRKYKWIEGEKGRRLSWPEARAEWTRLHSCLRKRQGVDEEFFIVLSFAGSFSNLSAGSVRQVRLAYHSP
jgi:hypothetical protein